METSSQMSLSTGATTQQNQADPFAAMNNDEEMKSYEHMVNESQKLTGVVTK